MEYSKLDATELNNTPISGNEVATDEATTDVIKSETAGEDSAPAQKKRGRPRKTPLPTEDDSDEVAPKKRGRPRKLPLSTDEGNEEAAPKKRGRPKKSVEPTVDGEAVASAPKKRGRPRKLAESVTELVPTATVDEDTKSNAIISAEDLILKPEANEIGSEIIEASEAEAVASKSATSTADESNVQTDKTVTELSGEPYEAEDSPIAEDKEEAPESQDNQDEIDGDDSNAKEEKTDYIQSPTISFEEQAQFYSYGDEIYAPSIFGDPTDASTPEEIKKDIGKAYAVSEDGSQLTFFEEEEPELNVVFNEIPPFVPYTKKDSKIHRAKVYNSDYPRHADTFFDFIELLIISLVAVLILTSFFFRHSKVQGDSMLQTLEDGDHLIISDFMYKPQRGDIVVIEDYSTGYNIALVKRVIALGGDTVEIREGQVYVNGEMLNEPYVYLDNIDRHQYMRPQTVPEGKLFVLGDHRNDSADSRVFGFVDESGVLGKALIRVYPFEKFGVIEE